MNRWRKVTEKKWTNTEWTLHLECGHDGFRSGQYSPRELPERVICEACKDLIGCQVKKPLGTFGQVISYSKGLFEIVWNDSGQSRWTLDQLREESEII